MSNILLHIADMGFDPTTTIESIDGYVDACIAFILREQATSPELDLGNDIFDLEEARQSALIIKYSCSYQP